jgi:hypothetical protein
MYDGPARNSKLRDVFATCTCSTHLRCVIFFLHELSALTFIRQSSAERALELHGRELEPDRAISVPISNPELKKERSDADANERELCVAGLSKFATKEDLFFFFFETVSPFYVQ